VAHVHEREILVRVAEVVMPPGHTLSGGRRSGGPACGALLRQAACLRAPGIPRAGLGPGERPLARHATRFTRLDEARAIRLLEQWRGATYYLRLALRVLTAPLKIAHFDDPDIFKLIGCRYAVEPPRPRRRRAGSSASSPGRVTGRRRSRPTWWCRLRRRRRGAAKSWRGRPGDGVLEEGATSPARLQRAPDRDAVQDVPRRAPTFTYGTSASGAMGMTVGAPPP